MKVFTEPRQKKLFEITREYYRNHKFDYGHDIDHVARVIWWCIFLSKKEKADLSILMPAVILHDVGRAEGVTEHVSVSYNLCSSFLKKCGYSRNDIEKISEIILRHSKNSERLPLTKEEKIIWDADKLDAINAIGLHRWFAGYSNYGFHHAEIKKIFEDVRFWKKVLGNPPFYTKTAKKIGLNGLKYVEKVFNDILRDYKKFRKIYKELDLE